MKVLIKVFKLVAIGFLGICVLLIALVIYWFYWGEPFYPYKIGVQNYSSIEEEWDSRSTFDGCAVGGQYIYNGVFKEEGSCMNGWESSFKSFDQDSVLTFLLAQFENRDTSGIHICPVQMATKNELAVYTLQAVVNKNWYELDTSYSNTMDRMFQEMEEDTTYSTMVSTQSVLHYFLGDSLRREQLKNDFISGFEEMRSE